LVNRKSCIASFFEEKAASISSSPFAVSPLSIIGRTASACATLFALTLRRQFFSRQTLVCAGLTLLCAAIVLAWGMHRPGWDPSVITKRFAERVLMPTYVGFLMPIFAISYGATGIGGEREDRTLIYLLITPIPRALLYLTKAAAILLLAVAWAAGTLTALCWLAGNPGRDALPVFLPAAAIGTVAYAALFLLVGAMFRHGTIISLAYWFFLEVLLGSMPGTIKRITISFFVQCLIYDAGEEQSLRPVGRVFRENFQAVSGDTAWLVLSGTVAGLLALGAAVLTTREYSELG
jgi:ABC-2 type transport system permease protein